MSTAQPTAPQPPAIIARTARSLRDFLKQESSGGIVLMAAAAIAIVWANSPLAPAYFSALETEVAVTVGGTGVQKSALLWINDALMALFFLLVGLEVKREVLTGQLSSWQQSSLPIFAALGGMAAPALVFVAINLGSPGNLQGWAIPAATDIAFALGILALLGSRVPVALKALLLAVAVIDDIGAIAIIALFYTPGVDISMLGSAAVVLVLLAGFGYMRVGSSIPYAILGVALWYFVLKSGVHATLAGVALAMCIPMVDRRGEAKLEHWEHELHPWVAFLVVPIFALANAGVSFEGMEPAALLAPLPLGIALGLLVGKQIGIFGLAWLAVKSGIARLPDGVGWLQVWGLSLIAGIGFTMSLFIGNLAFASPEQINAVKLGVLSGSVIAAIAGVLILLRARRA
ncbi:Na+/H+ antiporter NhaA [Alteriqipengyuania lutimaris]|uniref:Na(+)/H(+) antiporter NhaA n=1 Tax=Alteriqipengyuania lutimaris TaxID=1538146 RepID=A0A395LMN5_9SPHN|nr:Na+/H+ antiporter NhaA [Alteriqipengyuania lutimaris]MBB3033295.1 NhaA family Na+:H+ antiporter [Alteriqipengyuania lutimaris]RDS77667.1 Na+/H+ antiporter NhaA [Alteriqipengyuania lutimaris]